MDTYSELESTIYIQDIGIYLDILRHEFNIKFKNPNLMTEILFFQTYHLVDNNSLFNYTYIYNYYQSLLFSPSYYIINIILTERNYLSRLSEKIIGSEFFFGTYNGTIIYEITSDILFIDTSDLKFNLYLVDWNIISHKGKQILENATRKEIEKYVSIENKKNSFIISSYKNIDKSTNKGYYENTIIYHFIIHPCYCFKEDDYKKIENYIDSKNELDNKELLNLIDKINANYFKNKKIYLDSYFTHYIEKRTSIIQRTINVIFAKSNTEKAKNILASFIPEKNNEEFKDIILKNYIIAEKIYTQEINDSYNVIPSNKNFIEIIYKRITKHIKSETKFFNSSLIHYNSLINDNISLSTSSNFIINEEIKIEYYRNTFNNLVKSEIDSYEDKIYQLMDNFTNSIKEYVINEKNTISRKINSIIFTTEKDFKYLLKSYETILINLKEKTKNIIKELDNLNMNLFTKLNNIIKENGISSKNYDQIISDLKIELDLKNSVQNLFSKKVEEFKQLGISIGISSTLGLATTGFVFGLNSASSFIGSQIIAGALVGPIGIVAGAAICAVSFLGRTLYLQKKNKTDLINLENDLKNAIQISLDYDLLNIQYAFEENKCYIERNLVQIKIFIEILVNRAIMSKSNY